MLTKTTAAGAREALGRLRRGSLEPYDYLNEVSALVRRVVPHDVSGWMTLDPDTMLSSGTLEAQKSTELDRALWRNELLQDGDVHKLAELARRPSPVTALSQLDAATAADSPRVQQILRPAGIGDGLRVMLRAGGATWGHAGIHRELGARDFDPDEQAFLAAIADDIANGLRRSLSRSPQPGTAVLVPGVVAFDAQAQVISATAEASRIMALMPGDANSTLYAVAIGASRRDRASARVRLADGRWLLLQGGRMHGAVNGSTHVTVSLMPAPRADLTTLLLRLHALSARQREVAELLMSGPRTDEIAAQLHISSHTLRDHVKAIFAKLGVQGRAELMAMVSDHA
ncbi:MAG: transcriptional regulator, LuxR family [Frankiales bacterium]|nr:transcriptional regulator, LuxR family [Frankiales bacterium]